MEKPMIIGIAGCSGSGKTTIAESIVEEVPSIKEGLTAIIVKMDNYYQDLSNISFEERVRLNYDHPDAFDWLLLRKDLTALAKGHSIHRPDYSFKEHTRKPETVLIKPADVIIFEGILAFYDEYIRDLMQFKYFVDTDPDLCLARRIRRDTEERGRTLESVLNQWLNQVRLMFKEFVEPTKKYADIVFEWDGDVQKIKEILVSPIYKYYHEVLEKGRR